MNDTPHPTDAGRPDEGHAVLAALSVPGDHHAAIEYLLAHADNALPALIEALDGPDLAAACRAAEALGALPGLAADAVSPLGRQALYGPPAVAAAAAAALGNLPASRASVITLEEALRSEHAEVRHEAALSLARVEVQGAPVLSRRAGGALAGLEAADAGAVSRAALLRLEPAPRARLVAAALEADLRATLDAIEEAASRRTTSSEAEEVLVRTDTLRALTRRLTPETAPYVAPPLAAASRALLDRAPHDAEIGHAVDAVAHTLLEALYASHEALERAPLLSALETLGARAHRTLSARLADEEPERIAPLAGVLAEIGWQPTSDRAGARFLIARGRWDECAEIGVEATGPLIEAFLDARGEAREMAARALERLGWAPSEERLLVPYLVALGRWGELDRLQGDIAPRLADELADERAEALGRSTPGYRVDVRVGLAEALARLGGPGAHHPLAAALAEDPAAAVRSVALRGLRREGVLDAEALAQAFRAEYAAACEPPASLPDEDSARAERSAAAALRAELVEALAAAGGDGAMALILQAFAAETESVPREAAGAALAALAERAPDRAADAVRECLGDADGEALGAALAQMGEAPAEALAALLGEEHGEASTRAAAVLVAYARAGGEIGPLLRPILLGGTPEARLAAARIFDRLDRVPVRADEAAAYWLAKGQWERCEAVGEPALAVLADALPVYDWRTAGAIGLALLRLGADPNAALFDALISRLRQVVARRDERLEPSPADEEDGRGRRPAPIVVSHEEERRTAKAYITAIEGLRSKR